MSTQHLDNRGFPPPEPMVRILRALAELPPGDDLSVLMDREPHPLYMELERRGWRWEFGWDGPTGVLVIARDTGDE